MFRSRVASALLSVVLATGLAGCGQDAGTDSGTAVTPTQSSAAVAGTGTPAAVPEELKFTAETVDGQRFSGESLAGKAAVLWFWAPWCPKCRAEAPRVAAAAQANTGRVTFVGVAAQDALPAMREFITDYRVGGFSHLADLDAAIWTRFGVTQQPAYAFISPNGTVEVVKQQLPESALTERVGALAAA